MCKCELPPHLHSPGRRRRSSSVVPASFNDSSVVLPPILYSSSPPLEQPKTATAGSSSSLAKFFQFYHRYQARVLQIVRFVCFSLPLIIRDLVGMVLSLVILASALFRWGWYYFVTSSRITVPYANDSFRQQIDIYPSLRVRQTTTTSKQAASPTVLFIPGGAWVTGHRQYGVMMARTLTAAGITVAVADYRNYPLASVPTQINDVEKAVQWTLENIGSHGGGDANNLVVVSESAGCHLVMMALLRRVIFKEEGSSSSSSSRVGSKESSRHCCCNWQPHDIKGFVAMSPAVNLKCMEKAFLQHGWDKYILDAIFGGQMEHLDPYSLLVRHNQSISNADNFLKGQLPPIQIYQGTHDRSVPLHSVQLFASELKRAGANADLTLYPGWTHVRPVTVGPMDGEHGFFRDVFGKVQEWTTKSDNKDNNDNDDGHYDLQFPPADSDLLQRLCPEPLCQLGAALMPY